MVTADDVLLVRPTPPHDAPRAAAARPEHLDEASVALVDSMLNPSSGWGTGILDAVEARLRSRWERATGHRIARPQLGVHQPDRWAAAMAARHAAIVIAAGD